MSARQCRREAASQRAPKGRPTCPASSRTQSNRPAAQLETLADAAQLIADLEQFRQARPVWDRAAEMILLAARTGRKVDIAEATRSLEVALWKENWLKG